MEVYMKLTKHAIVGVSAGCAALEAVTKRNFEIPITLTGRITGPWGDYDGIDQDFEVDVIDFKIGNPVRVPKDKLGRPWALAKNVVAGDKLQCDAGFTCIKPNAIKTVRFNPKQPASDAYYITCDDGRHYLNGQLGYTPETKGAYVGLYPVK
jgi:hypothetical protein